MKKYIVLNTTRQVKIKPQQLFCQEAHQVAKLKAFNRISRKVMEWVIRKKGVPEVFVPEPRNCKNDNELLSRGKNESSSRIWII